MYRHVLPLLLLLSLLSCTATKELPPLTYEDHIAVGGSVHLCVRAQDFWTYTGIKVEKGEVYRFFADGHWQDNGWEASDANGIKSQNFAMRMGIWLKRMSTKPYMMLGGSIGKHAQFPIGRTTTKTMKRNGMLYLFPNDARGFFENNKDSLHVTIIRIE